MSSDSRVDDFDFINAREAYQRLSCNEVELPGEVLVLVKSIRAYLARGEVEPRVISGPLTTNQETQDRLNEFESRAAFRLALDEAREIFNRLDPGEQDCAADIKRIRSILTKVGCPIRLLQCASTGATDEQVEARLRAIEAACSRPSQRSR